MSGKNELKELARQHIPRGLYTFHPIFPKEAKGALIRDQAGASYVDFTSGIAVINAGHCREEIVSAIRDQASRYLHVCPHVMMYEPYVRLAEMLNQKAPCSGPAKTMLCNSGAEAVENAIKIARHYSRRRGVIAFEHAYHGRTLLGMSLTGRLSPYKKGFGPFAPHVYRAPYPYCYRCHLSLTHPECRLRCLKDVEDVLWAAGGPEDIGALIIEPILGEGGVVVPPEGYMAGLSRLCKRYGLLMIADEIQTGLGRTGTLFALERFEAAADIITAGKALGGGLPLSAVIGRADVMDSPPPGALGGTFGGNPVACSAALCLLELLEKGQIPDRALRLGQRLIETFQGWKERFSIIGDVRGMGAMIGLELVRDRATKEPARQETRRLLRYCLQRGLILVYGGSFRNVVRILPPLTIGEEELERGLAVLEEGLKEISG